MTAHKVGSIIGTMLGEAIKGFCFGIGALVALRLAILWAGA